MPATAEDHSWIDRFDGLGSLEPRIRDVLTARSQVIRLAAGTTIFGPGKSPDHLLLLLQGTVRVQQLSESGREVVLYRVTAGEETLTGYGDLPTPGPGGQGQVVFDMAKYRGVEIRTASLTRPVLAGVGPVLVTVTVGQTRDGADAIAGELSWLAAVLSVAFFLVAVALSALVARTSLKPLNELAAAVSRRGPSDLRPLSRPAPADLAPLLTALNRLMDRLRTSIRRSEDFIAEAAHRIRTPLATVRAQAEIALRTAREDTEKERLRRIIRAVDESSRSAGQLLDHATVAYRTEHLADDPLDLADLTARTAAAMEPTASMRDIRLNLEVAPARIAGDAILIETAIRNVLDNAIKYSPEDTVVSLRVACTDGEARLTVTDQGPGLGDEPVDALTERFRRGRNTESVVGSGLGLTIVADVLRAHGGRLELTGATKGKEGACVSLVLPQAWFSGPRRR